MSFCHENDKLVCHWQERNNWFSRYCDKYWWLKIKNDLSCWFDKGEVSNLFSLSYMCSLMTKRAYVHHLSTAIDVGYSFLLFIWRSWWAKSVASRGRSSESFVMLPHLAQSLFRCVKVTKLTQIVFYLLFQHWLFSVIQFCTEHCELNFKSIGGSRCCCVYGIIENLSF